MRLSKLVRSIGISILVITGSVVLPTSPASAAGSFFEGSVVRAHDAEVELLDTINRLRAEVYGLDALDNRNWGEFEEYLECIAQENSANARLAHYPASCNQAAVEAEILAARYSSLSGGSTNALVEQWNDSTGHRQIMLAADADYAHVGVYCIGNTSWAIAWIGRTDGYVSPNQTPRQVPGSSFFVDDDYRCRESAPVPVNDPLRAYEPAGSLEALVNRPDFGDLDADVLRLYRAFFQRDPDIDGANYWLDRSRRGLSIGEISYSFAGSEEFGNTYGNVDNRRYLEILYNNVHGRNTDPAGLEYWLAALEDGRLSRGGVVRWIAAGDEFERNNPYGGR